MSKNGGEGEGEERERGREFGWVAEKERKNDENLGSLGRYIGKVRVSHHIRCVAYSEPHIIDVIS